MHTRAPTKINYLLPQLLVNFDKLNLYRKLSVRRNILYKDIYRSGSRPLQNKILMWMFGIRRQCKLNYNFLLVNFILCYPNFRLRELVFPWYFLNTFNLVHKL